MAAPKPKYAEYDYDKQEWVEGDRALILIAKHDAEELPLLDNPDYLALIGWSKEQAEMRKRQIAAFWS